MHKKRRYLKVSDEQREELIRRIVNGNRTVIDVAQEMGLDYENCKLIYRVYRREGRVKQTPKQIKKYATHLKSDLASLRAKVSAKEFDRITQMWAGMWQQNQKLDTFLAAQGSTSDSLQM